MDYSSEDSFIWTDTSSDSTDISTMAVEVNDKVEEKQIEPDHKSVKKRKSKHMLNRNSTEAQEINESKPKVKIEKESNDESCCIKKKRVKSEPESECDLPKKKKKIKNREFKGNDDIQDSASYDESYLDIKVKQENMCLPSPVQKTKKKNKLSLDVNDSKSHITLDNKSNYSDTTEDNLGSNIQYESSISKSKKKKKKSKRNSYCEQDGEQIDDKMDIDNIDMDSSSMNNKSESKLRTKRVSDASYNESEIFQDETNCSELSAIEGDTDHSLHTTSFNDINILEKHTKKKNDDLHKSTVLNQFKQDQELQSTAKRRPRISDRILFEEVDGEESELSINTEDKMSSKLKKFLKTNSNLQVLSQELQQNSILSSDDEIWMIKCPSNVDTEAFSDIDLNINAKCKVKLFGQTYDGSIDEEPGYPATILSMKDNKYEIRNFPLCGVINFRRRIPKAHFRDDNIMLNNQTNFIPLPEIKCRHPLFGLNYKKALKIPAAVAERLNRENSEENTPVVEKRKKKKHKKDKSLQEYEETDTVNNISIPKSQPDAAKAIDKKKKKRKHVEDEGPAPKKAKKIKYDPECAEVWDSEKAIEQNLFDF